MIDYDTLLDNPEKQLYRIADVIGVSPTDAIKKGIKEYSENFLETSLRHHKIGPSRRVYY